MNAEPRPDSFAGLASSLVDDRAIVDAIDLAVAGLAAEIDCEAQAAGIRELLDILGVPARRAL